MRLKKSNQTGLNYAKVCEKLEGDITFVNEFCVNGEYDPVAVFHSKNPDKSKGHKEYILIQSSFPVGTVIIRGMTKEEIIKYSTQLGIYCSQCDDVIYSVYRHHYHSCSCGKTSVDGGKEYFKVSGNNPQSVIINLLTDEMEILE